MVLAALLLLVVIVWGFPTWAALLAPEEFEFTNDPFPVRNSSSIRPGDPLSIETGSCNHSSRPLAYTFTRTLERIADGQKTSLDPGGIELPPGCRTRVGVVRILPDQIEPGAYKVTYTLTIQERWRRRTVHAETEPFVVVPP